MNAEARKPRPYIPYDVPLGEGERARLVLPQDLTEAEAERLCGVIRTLAFSDAELAAVQAEFQRRFAERQAAVQGTLGALMAEWAAADDPATERGQIAAKLSVNPQYQSALRDAESESWDGLGIEASAMIEAANERRRAAQGRAP